MGNLQRLFATVVCQRSHHCVGRYADGLLRVYNNSCHDLNDVIGGATGGL